MEEIEHKVYESLGQASMAWSEIPTGVFEDKEAVKIAEALIRHIKNNKNITIRETVERLCEELVKDRAYYYGWQANIAMAFQDEYYKHYKEMGMTGVEIDSIHKISNNAAKNFLNLLIKQK